MQVWQLFLNSNRSPLKLLHIMKSWLLWGLALLVLAWMTYQLLFSHHGYGVYQEEQQQLRVLQTQAKTLEKKREDIARRILQLRHNPKVLEDLAHQRLGYVYPDEYILMIPDEKQVKESK